MALTLPELGTTHEQRHLIEASRTMAYAAATNDENPAYWTGRCAPPIYGVVASWEAITQAVEDVVPSQARAMIVHGEQDMHFGRPLAPDQALVSRARAQSVRVGPSGTRCTIRSDSVDEADGRAVLEQYVTIFIRGLTTSGETGPEKPGHSFPESARSAPLGSQTAIVRSDQTFRYREASGDDSPIHTDEALARSVGMPGIIVHGLCTMAMASQAVLNLAAGGDPGRLRRMAVRFAKMVLPGQTLSTTVYDAGERNGCRALAFETMAYGGDREELVITHGWAEVSS